MASPDFVDHGGRVDLMRLTDGRVLMRLTDGRVACCICFEYRTRDQLEPTGDGKVWDVCRGECARQAGIPEQHDPSGVDAVRDSGGADQ